MKEKIMEILIEVEGGCMTPTEAYREIEKIIEKEVHEVVDTERRWANFKPSDMKG